MKGFYWEFILQTDIDPKAKQKSTGEIELPAGVFNSFGKLIGVVSATQEFGKDQIGHKGIIPKGTKVAFVTTSKEITGMKLNSQ